MSFSADLAKFPSATSVTMNSEGGSATTNVQQGLAKHSSTTNPGASSGQVFDSFNQASITDNSAGDFSLSFTNVFGNVNFSSTGMTENQYTTARGGNVVMIDSQFNTSNSLTGGNALSTSARTYTNSYGSSTSGSGGKDDQAPVMVINFGDLA
jgi:hypothetical protein